MHGPGRWSRARRNVLALVLGLEALTSLWLAIGMLLIAIIGAPLFDALGDGRDPVPRLVMGIASVVAGVVGVVCGLAAVAVGGRLGFEDERDRIWRAAIVAAIVVQAFAVGLLVARDVGPEIPDQIARWASTIALGVVCALLWFEARLRRARVLA